MNEPAPTDDRTTISSARAIPDGTRVRKSTDNSESARDPETTPWEGPYPEYDKDGTPTGTHYYRCRDCGREILSGIDRRAVSHREGCRFGVER